MTTKVCLMLCVWVGLTASAVSAELPSLDRSRLNEPTGSQSNQSGLSQLPLPAAPTLLKGEVLKIEGDSCVVKDETGKQVNLKIDDETQTNKSLKVGDKVMAKMEPEGNLWSVKKLNGE